MALGGSDGHESYDTERRVVVRSLEDVPAARRAAQAAARAAGLCKADVAVVALIASELATNLARYAPGGALAAGPLGARCMRIVAEDDGPGIDEPARALVDGYSTGGGLGGGLGTVRRLTDRFDLRTSSGGTRIEVMKCCAHPTR